MADADRPGAGDAPTVVSKSQRKRDAQACFELGRRLTDLPEARLRELPLSADLLEAVLFARSIRSRAARKRQLGYLGGLLRNTDVTPILDALDRQSSEARRATVRQHRVEAWRDALIHEGDRLLARLVNDSGPTHAQSLRQLIMGARREQARGKPPASARKLFKLLRRMDEESPLPPLTRGE